MGISRETTLPGLPEATSPQFLDAVRQFLLTWGGRKGDPLDEKISYRDMLNGGMLEITGTGFRLVGGTGTGGGGGTPGEPGPVGPPGPPGEDILDTTPPPLVTGLEVTPTVLTLVVTFDQPAYYRFADPLKGSNHAYTEIWRAQELPGGGVPALGNAVLVGTTTGSVFPDPLGPTGGVTYYYWVRNVSRASITGDFNATPASGTTAHDPATLIDLLNGAISITELATSLATRIDLIDAPETTIGSVAERIAQEAAARVAAISAAASTLQGNIDAEIATRASQVAALETDVTSTLLALSEETLGRQQADVATLESATAYSDGIGQAANAFTSTWAYSRADSDAALAGQATTLRAEITAGDGNSVDTAKAYTEFWAYSKAQADGAISTSASTLTANFQAADAATIAAAEAYVATYAYSKASTDSAIASEATILRAEFAAGDADTYTDAQAYVQSYAYSQAATDSAIATSSDTLRAQFAGTYTGTDVTQVTSGLFYSERTARANADNALSQQITLLSAGSGEQFDPKTIWYFDSGVESWTGNGTPTATSGWLKPANHATDPYAQSPDALGVDGATYPQVKARIRKTATPTWEGRLRYITVADTTWNDAKSVTKTEPTYDGNGIAVLTWDMSGAWLTGTIKQVRVELSTNQDSTNYFEIDWVAIGRASPGASVAALLAEETARTSADSAEVTARQALSSKVTGANDPASLTLGTLSAGLLYDERQARSTAVSTEVTSRQTLLAKVTGLAAGSSDAQVNALTLAALSSGLIYDERTARTTADSSQVTRLNALEATVNDAQTGVSATATALDAVELTVNNASTGNAALGTRTSTIETKLAPGGSTANAIAAAATTAAWASVSSRPANLVALNGSEAIKNSLIGINANGTLSGAGAGQVTAAGLGAATTVALVAEAGRIDALETSLASGGATANAIAASQTTANTALSTAQGKVKTYLQPTAPASGLVVGDLWLDSDDGNKPYRWSGSAWVDATDLRISSQVSRIDVLEASVNNPTTGLAATGTALDVVEALVNSGTTGNNALVAKTDTIFSRLANAGRALFVENWEDPNALAQWQVMSGAAERSIVSVSDGKVGGKALRVGNNAGHDSLFIQHVGLIPFDPDLLYKITAVVRRESGAGVVFIGWEGYAADGVTIVRTDGTPTGASRYYHGANNQSPALGTAWTTYTGYTKGVAATGVASAGTRANPSEVHQNVKYLRPIVLLVWGANPTSGIHELNSLTVEISEAADIDAAVQTETTARVTEAGAQAQQISTLQAVVPTRAEVHRRPDTPPLPSPALKFNVAADYVEGPASALWDIGAGDFSFETWVKFDSAPALATLFELGVFTTGVLLRQNTAGSMVIYIAGSAAGQFASFAFVPSLTKHYHVCVTRTAGSVRLYVDSTATGVATSVPGSIAPTSGLRLGSARNGTNQPLKGRLWKFRAYSRALSSAEVTEHFLGSFLNETGLIVNMPLSEGSGTTANDLSANALDGTLTGTPTWLTQTAHATGTIWYDTDDGNKAYVWDGNGWVLTDDARIGQSVAALQVEASVRAQAVAPTHSTANTYTKNTVVQSNGTLYRALQAVPAGTALANTAYWAVTLANLYAQYTIKADINGRVSGIGLAAEPAGSTLLINADKFAIGHPADTYGPDAAQQQDYPFMVVTTPTTINGVEVPVGVYLRDAYIHTATITNAMIARAGIDRLVVVDADIATLNANKITTGTLAANTRITVGGGITIDANGSITADAPDRKVVMTAGNVVAYKKVAGVDYPYNALSRVENGTAQNNTQVVIPGYFLTQPRVIVSPAQLAVFDPTFAAQKQTLNCSPGAVTESATGSMTWRFTPTATLELAANTQTLSPNTRVPVSGEDATNTWWSAAVTTPANTTHVRPTVQVSSVRGTGVSPTYFLRLVVISIEYWNGTAWVAGPSLGTINIGASLSDSASTQLAQYAFPSAGTWQWRLKFVASDAGGTFDSGVAQFEFSTTIGPVSSFGITETAGGFSNPASRSRTVVVSDPAPPAGTGWSFFDATYKLTAGGLASNTNQSGGSANATAEWFGLFTGNYIYNHRVTAQFTSDGALVGNQYSIQSEVNTTTVAGMQLLTTVGFQTYIAQHLLVSASKDIRWVRAVANSITPQNHSILNSYIHTLTGASVLASGTLNWIAIGG